MNNRVNLTIENKMKIEKTIKHTKMCGNYLNFLFDKVVEYKNDDNDKSEKYLSLKSSINLVNNWYEKNFVKMIVDGHGASSDNNTKIIEANAQPIKYLLDVMYTFIDEDQIEAAISVEELFESVVRIYKEVI